MAHLKNNVEIEVLVPSSRPGGGNFHTDFDHTIPNLTTDRGRVSYTGKTNTNTNKLQMDFELRSMFGVPIMACT